MSVASCDHHWHSVIVSKVLHHKYALAPLNVHVVLGRLHGWEGLRSKLACILKSACFITCGFSNANLLAAQLLALSSLVALGIKLKALKHQPMYQPPPQQLVVHGGMLGPQQFAGQPFL